MNFEFEELRAASRADNTMVGESLVRILDRMKAAIDKRDKLPDKCPRCKSKFVNYSAEDLMMYCHNCHNYF
jgi:ribosomal protein L37AE/L43A